MHASPTGFPFKIAQVPETLADPETYANRVRHCDLSYLRTPYLKDDGKVGYRCPSEPVHMYVRKGGDVAETTDRKCLCNGLTASVGLGQSTRESVEPPLVTLGGNLDASREFAHRYPTGWRVADVIDWLLS